MNAPGVNQLQDVIVRIISLSVGIAFMVMFIMLVVGGIKFLTSGGDQKAIASAQKTLTWSILGIVMLALAWIAIQIIQSFSGVTLTLFCLKFDGCN